jgi:phosphoserine phosphatase RsbU/P
MSVSLHRAWEWAGRPSNWLGVVFGIESVLAIAGIGIGGRFNLTAVLTVGPLLASARCSGKVTALVSCYAVALCLLVAAATGVFSATIQRERLVMVVLAAVLAVYVAVIRGRREDRLIRIAENVQRAILRPLPAELGGVAFASHYQSATPGTLVGGDLYDLTMTQFGPRFIIGDVKGKGLDAVEHCANVIAIFRELAFAEPDLVRLAERMDAMLSAQLGIEDFVTAILAEFGTGEVRLVNCGHQPPVKAGLASDSGEPEVIAPAPAATPLGLNPRPARQDVALKPGDRLLFYTDGLVEARDGAGRFLGLDKRVTDALALPGLDACLSRISAHLLEHAGRGLDDDVLLVVCEPLA